MRHAYSYSTICGTFDKEWIKIDQDLKYIQIEAPTSAESAAISIQITQVIEEEGGKMYAGASQSFNIYIGDGESHCHGVKESSLRPTDEVKLPLRVRIHSMTKDGNLTIGFSRPIEIPQVFNNKVVRLM